MAYGHIVFQRNGLTAYLQQDESDTNNPREWSNLSKMLCSHRRYSLGDDLGFNSSQFDSWNEVEQYIHANYDPVFISPLFLFDHSGITISMNGFGQFDPHGFDWGQVGFVFVSRADALKEYGVKRITADIQDKILKVVSNEVKTYDNYLRGEVYSIRVEDEAGDVLDSCAGYIGYEWALESAEEMLEHRLQVLENEQWKALTNLGAEAE